MVQLNIIAGSLGLFVHAASAGPCRPTDTTVLTTEPATSTTDLTTATATETTAPVATTSAVPEEEPSCNFSNGEVIVGDSGVVFQLYCDRYAGGTTPIGGILITNSLSDCLDHCDNTPGCQGANYITTNLPYCSIWSTASSFGDQKGVILIKRQEPIAE